jgi:hypothetical protein
MIECRQRNPIDLLKEDRVIMPSSPQAILALPPAAMPMRSTLDTLAAIPEEAVWLASRKSPETRKA